jgi:hypothetical protein
MFYYFSYFAIQSSVGDNGTIPSTTAARTLCGMNSGLGLPLMIWAEHPDPGEAIHWCWQESI